MQRGHWSLIWRMISCLLKWIEADQTFLLVVLWLLYGLTFARVRTATDDIANPTLSEQTSNFREVTTTKGNPEEVIRWRQETHPTHQGS